MKKKIIFNFLADENSSSVYGNLIGNLEKLFIKDMRDRVLNGLCLLLILIMGICAWVAGQHVQSANSRRMVTVVR